MPLKSQSEFDSNGGIKIYANPEDAPKGKSEFAYILEEYSDENQKKQSKQKHSEE